MNELSTAVRLGPQSGFCCCSCRKIDTEDCSLNRNIYRCGTSGAPVYSASCLSATSSNSTKPPPCNFCFTELAMAAVGVASLEDYDLIDYTQNSQDDLLEKEEDEDEREDEEEDEDEELSSSSQSVSKKRKEVNADGSSFDSNMDFTLESFFNKTQGCPIVEPFGEFFRNVLVPDPGIKRAQYKEKCQILRDNLFVLLCAISFYKEDSEIVPDGPMGLVTEGPMNSDDQCTALVLRFNSLFQNIHLQSKYKIALFEYFPDDKWPDGFEEWIEEKATAEPTKSFIKKNKINVAKFKKEELVTMYFGHVIMDTAKKAKEYVTGKMNPMWTDNFPSGFNQTGTQFSYIHV